MANPFKLGGIGAGANPCCCGGSTTFCVTVCTGPAIALYGAVVTVLGNSCTTDATGCCSIPGLSGTQTVTVTFDGTTIYSASRTMGGTVGISIPTPSNIICCNGYYIPKTLTLTDVLGTLTFTYNPGLSGTFPTWLAVRGVSKSGAVPATNPGGICTYGAPGTQTVGVCYKMTCLTGSSPKFSGQRFWDWTNISGTNYYISYATPGCGSLPGCNNTDVVTGTANPTSSSPFAISFTLSGATTMTDPVGGGVSVSQ